MLFHNITLIKPIRPSTAPNNKPEVIYRLITRQQFVIYNRKRNAVVHFEGLVSYFLVVVNVQGDITVINNVFNHFLGIGQNYFPYTNIIYKFAAVVYYIDYVNGFAVFAYFANMVNY